MTRLITAEALKLRSTRTSYGLLLAALLLGAIAVTALVASGDSPDAADLLDAAAAGYILVLIAGILAVTTDYRHGTITTTYLVEPVRERVVAAKLVAGAAAGVVYGLLVLAIVLAMAVPWLSVRDEPVPGTGEIAGQGARMLLTFALAAMLGVGFGALIRNQLGAVVLALVWLFVVESLVQVLYVVISTQSLDDDPEGIGPYLPGSALDAIVGEQGAGAIGWAGSAGVAAVYVAVLAVAGALMVARRDP